MSDLSAGTTPTESQATTSIRHAVLMYGGIHGCAVGLAHEYGEHPETASARMRWARAVVDSVYRRPLHRGTVTRV